MITSDFDIHTLLDPAVFPWPVDAARLIETHISWVLLAGDRVVKLKRPVDLGFVDFRDPAKRKQACEDEVRLNRRLTTDVYLGVVPITANGIDAPGEPLEWATLMRRMPAERMLDLLLADGSAPANLAELLADRLIPFHQRSSRAPHPSSRAASRDPSLPKTLGPAETQGPGAMPRATGDSSTSVGMTGVSVGMTASSSSRAEPRDHSFSSSRAESRDRSLPEHPSSASALPSAVILNEERDRSLPEHSSSTHTPSPAVILNEVKDLSRSGLPDASPTGSNPPIHEQPPEHPRGEILRVAQNDNETGSALGMAERVSGNTGAHGEAAVPAGCPVDPGTYLAVLTDNLDQVADVAGDILGNRQLDLVDRSMRAFMESERPMLEERCQTWLVDGHGDLRCEHVCLEPDVMQIYDCVEFEIAIRCADVASDLAFLVMDLHRLGARSVADELVHRYRAAGFDLPRPVIDLYGAHRALVRAKVAALERSGADPDHDRAAAFESAAYLDIATSFATPIAPALILVSGLSGSGKSTVAAAIGRATGGTIFASDRARKELAGMDAFDSGAAEWHQGIYSGDWTARTYDRLLASADAELASGRTAIVDATFLDNRERERFVAAARTRTMPVAIVWTELDDAIARQRLERRARAGNSPSDATVAIRERQQRQLRETPLHVPAGAIPVTIDTGRSGPASLDPFITAMQEHGLIGTLRTALAANHA